MLGGTMCELGIYSVSRPHTDKQGEGGRDVGREDMKKKQTRVREKGRWKQRD